MQNATWADIFRMIYERTGMTGLIGILVVLAILVMGWELIKGVAKGIAEGKIAYRLRDWIPFLKTKPDTDVNLESHLVFDKYELMIARVNTVGIKCALRRKIYCRLMSIRLESHRDQLRLFCKEDYDSMDHDGFKIAVLSLMSKSHVDWKNRVVKAEIPHGVIAAFDASISDVKELSDNWITTMCDSTRFYTSNSQKVCAILDILAALESCVLSKTEQLLVELNGELSKLEFEGERCENCDPSCEFRVEHIHDLRIPRGFKRILYVEDDKALATAVQRLFKRNGVDVLTAKTVREAKLVLENDLVDAAILDFVLGGETAIKLEEALTDKNIPFVYYTGADRTISRIHTEAQIVPKTVTPADLLRTLIEMSNKK